MYVMHAILANFGSDPDAPRSAPPPIRVWSTTDEGRHWEGPTDLRTPVPPDHPRMVVDLSGGPHHGRLYLVWNDVADMFVRTRYELFLQYSDDGGKTFTDPALWLDRRNGTQELFTTRIELTGALPPPSLVEADVTERIEIRVGTPRLERSTGTVVIPVQARNVSGAPVYGPLELRIVDIAKAPAGVSATLENAQAAEGAPPRFRFEGKLGTDDVLSPGSLSEPIEIRLKTTRETGLDATLDFRVIGRVLRTR